MSTKTKQIVRTLIAIVVWIIGMFLLIRIADLRITFGWNIVAGGLLGGILIQFFQKWMPFDRFYPLRYVLYVLGMGLIVLIITVSTKITQVYSFTWGRIMVLTCFGAGIGLYIGLVERLTFAFRERKNPYTGDDQPILSSIAKLTDDQIVISHGRMLLLSDRLLFLGAGTADHEILLSEIVKIEISTTLFFKHRLGITLKNAEFVSITLSMPYIWKRKIQEALHCQPNQIL